MKSKRFRYTILLIFALLVCVSLACNLGAETGLKLPVPVSDVEVFAGDLGKVYGLAFDQKGNLFAVGSEGERSVLWKIEPSGAKEIFAEIKDEGDVLSNAGLANHSHALANVAIDGYGNVWITSLRHGAGFVVAADRTAAKVYFNTRLNVSLEEIEYPHGVAWDAVTQKLYIITSGPTSNFSYDNQNFITTLTPSAEAGTYAEEVVEITDTGGNQVRAIPNIGLALEETGSALLAGPDSRLYFLGKDSLFIVSTEGNLERFGESFEGQTLWDGIADDQGYMYVSTNTKEYDLMESVEGQGTIWRIDAQGERVTYVEGLKEPLGLALYDGYLYIADRAEENILRVPVEKAGTGKPAADMNSTGEVLVSPTKDLILEPTVKPTEVVQVVTSTSAPTMKPSDTSTPRPTATLIPTSTPEAFDFTANWLHFGYDTAHSAYNPLETMISSGSISQLEEKWGLGCDQSGYSTISRSPAIYHSRLYVTGANNKLVAFHAHTGRQLWTFGEKNMAWAPQPTVSEDGIVLYLQGESGLYELYALDAESGNLLWKAPIGFDLGFSDSLMPTVDEDNGLVYMIENTFMPQEGKLYALDKQTGEVVWYKSLTTDELSFIGDYLLINAGRIIVAAEVPGQHEGLYQQQVISIDAASQAVDLIYDLPPHDDYYSPYQIRDFTQCNEKIIVSYADEYHEPGKYLAAYASTDAAIVWQLELTQITGAIACNPTKNVIYVPTDPYLLAIDATTGAELWRYMGLGAIYSPSIANGLVYFISDTNLYVLEETTGERVFRYPLGAQGYESSQVAIVDGMIYFSGNGGTCDLFALGLP